MDPSLTSAVAATASAIAAFASVFISIRLATLTRLTLQVQIEPSVSIDFDHKVGTDRERMATVVNERACDVYDLHLRVSIVSDFDETKDGIRPTVYKLVGDHDLQRWIVPRVWRRRFSVGGKIEVDSDSWFTHAREVLSVASLTPAERTARGMVMINVACRRAADNRRFNFEYVYVVQGPVGRLIAFPCAGSNPADAEHRLIVRPVDD